MRTARWSCLTFHQTWRSLNVLFPSRNSAVPHCMFAALLGQHVITLPRLMAAQADPGAVKRMCHALAGTAVMRSTSRVNRQLGAPSLVGGLHGRRSTYGQYSQGAAQEVAALGVGQQGEGRGLAELVRLCGSMAVLAGGEVSVLAVYLFACSTPSSLTSMGHLVTPRPPPG